MALSVAVAVGCATGTASRADTVVKRVGGRLEGVVLRVDDRSVLIRTPGGDVEIAREQVETIHFAASVPPLKVEIRNVRSDDSIDVLLDDRVVVSEASEGGSWVDLTPMLKDGNNPLRLRIRNARGTWAYRLNLRINGEISALACGTALRNDDPCRCCGKTGNEKGVVDDLPVVWLWVDRATGRAEIAR